MPYMQKGAITGYFEITFAVFLWSTIEIVMKLIQNETSAILINFFRFFLGGITLFLVILIQKRWSEFKDFWRSYPKYYLPAALIGLVGGMLLFSYGTILTTAPLAATIISTNPILIATYMIISGREKKSLPRVVGIILGFLGIAIIITELKFDTFIADENILGNLLVFIGTILWVVDLIIGKILLSRQQSSVDKKSISSLEFNAGTFLITSLAMAPLLFLPRGAGLISQFSKDTWWGLLFLGVITTGIAYWFYFKGLEKLEASRGANLFYLKPIFSTIMSFFILHVVPSWFFYGGIFIELVALYLITKE